jgi:hypothetical protein
MARAGTIAVLLAAIAGAWVAGRRAVGSAPLGESRAGRSLRTPYAQTGPLRIEKVAVSSPRVPRYGRVEWTVRLSATYDNPFDPEDVSLEARVTGPSGKSMTVPGFLYRSYRRSLTAGTESLTAAGEPEWKLRCAGGEVGAYRAVVRLKDRTGRVEVEAPGFTVSGLASPGYVRVSSRDRRYFAFDSGRAYFPIGANVCWGNARGSFSYDDWLPKYAFADANYTRLWLSPHWTTFALERAGRADEGLGMGQYDLGNAWRLDHVLELAEARGIYLMLCIDSYNILRVRDAFPEWERTPHNAANGGPLARPDEFWTSAEMDRLYRNKLRYLVARYGCSPHVFSWEFWNEVDGISDYRSEPVRAWHDRMSAALRAIDPYRHLITTSFARTEGDAAIDRLPGLDFTQSHHYGSPDLAAPVVAENAAKARYGKPHFFGEIGADASGPRFREDLDGLQVHDPMWASLATGGAGTAMCWWWDSLIAPRILYPLYTPVARIARDVDWPSEAFRQVRPRAEWVKRPAVLPRQDLVLENGPVSWSAAAANRPKAVAITSRGASGDLPLAGIQHGTANHPDLHNPVTFRSDLPRPTRLEVEVGDVSGYGGAALTIRLDGAVVVSKEFADPDNGNETLRQYAGSYGVEIPAGRHEVVVENTGKDGFLVGFRVRGVVEASGPPLDLWAMAGRTTAIVWARVQGRTWKRICVQKDPPPPAPPCILVLPGLTAGRWRAEVSDTWSGDVIHRQEIAASGPFGARVRLPAVSRDLVVKLRRARG